MPPGDVLIHAGDLTRRGSLEEVREFDDWLGTLRHPLKIVIAGNHDRCFESDPDSAPGLLTSATYLHDSATTVDGLRIYGSPWQPWCLNWAFNLQRGSELREKWDLIPPDTDILVTHGPPFGRCDLTDRGEPVGCEDLLAAVERVRPSFHIFGHIHEAAGTSQSEHTIFINASVCDAGYRLAQPAVVFDCEPRSDQPGDITHEERHE